MANRKVVKAVERAAANFGATVEWQGGTKHNTCIIRLKNGGIVINRVHYGMDFDEKRMFKLVTYALKKEIRNE